ncbi:MAG: hypothetical protein ACRD2U_04805 [Terriglobales bacterium]
MQSVRAEPYNPLALIVPGRASVIVPKTKTVDRKIAGGRPDGPGSNWIRSTLVFERTNDRMGARVGEHRVGVETEISDETPARDPEIVSLTDARAAMPSKRRSNVPSGADTVSLYS